MLSFKNFLIEESKNPYGIIFDGPNKAYVGSHHTKPIIMSDDIKEKVLVICALLWCIAMRYKLILGVVDWRDLFGVHLRSIQFRFSFKEARPGRFPR